MPRKTTAASQQRRARRTGGGRPRLIIAALAVLAVVVAAGWALVPPLPPGKIAPGLRAGQWPVGGLTAEQAAQAISAGEQAAQGPVRLEVAEGGRSFPVPPEELGITPAGERAAQAAIRIGRTGSLPVQWWQRWRPARTGAGWRYPGRWTRAGLGHAWNGFQRGWTAQRAMPAPTGMAAGWW